MDTDEIKDLDFGFDSTQPERVKPEEDAKPRGRPSRPQRGPSAIVLLGFLVVGMLLVWMHHDFQKRIEIISAAGSARMTEQLDDKFSTLSLQLSEEKAKFDKYLSNLKAQLQKIDEAIVLVKKDQTAAKPLPAAVDGVQKTAASLKDQIDALQRKATALTAETAKLSKELAGQDEELMNTRMSIEQEMELLKSHGVDQSALNAALKKERVLQQEDMAKMHGVLSNSIRSLERDVAELRSRMGSAPANTAAN